MSEWVTVELHTGVGLGERLTHLLCRPIELDHLGCNKIATTGARLQGRAN